jgi:hypothetical protein
MRKIAVLLYAGVTGMVLAALLGMVPRANAQTQLQVYGLWHCGSDACSWAAAPNMTTFDTQNHWIIDRGNGSPSVNLVVLSFVSPLKLMNLTTDSTTTKGIPNGMTTAVVSYFESKGVRVMMSIRRHQLHQGLDQSVEQQSDAIGNQCGECGQAVQCGDGNRLREEQQPRSGGLAEIRDGLPLGNPV